MISENILEKNTQSGSMPFWPKVLHYITVLFFFLLPLQTRYIFRQPVEYGVPFEYGTLSIFGVEIIGWIVIVFSLAGTWKQWNLKRNYVLMLSCFLVLMSFLSVAWAPDKAIALQAAVRLLEGVLIFLVIRYRLYAERYTIAWAFIFGAVLQASLGIYQFLTQSTFDSTLLGMAVHDPRIPGTSVVEFGDQRWLRAYGGLPHPNVFGGYLTIALGLAIVMLQKAQRMPMLFLKVLIPALLTGIFFSFSRSAWLATATLAIYLVWQIWFGRKITVLKNIPQRQFIVYWALIIVYAATLVFVFRPLVAARFNSESRLAVKSYVERVAGIKEAGELIKLHPIVGVGIGNLTQGIADEIRKGDFLVHYQPVHSVPLLVWAELGSIGLLLFLGVLWFVAWGAKNYWLLSMSVFLLIFDHYFWSLSFGILLFWAFLGLSYAIHSKTS